MPKGLRISRRDVGPRARLGRGIRQGSHAAFAPTPSTPERAVPVTAMDESWNQEEADLSAKRWKGAVALFGVLAVLAYGATAPAHVNMEGQRAAIDDSSSRAGPGAFDIPPRADPMARALYRQSTQVQARLQIER